MSLTLPDWHALARYKRALRRVMPRLAEEYGVRSLALFGSFVRGTQNTRSDLDVLVEFDAGHALTLFEFVKLELELTDLLGIKVDLVDKEALRPRIGQRILIEAMPV